MNFIFKQLIGTFCFKLPSFRKVLPGTGRGKFRKKRKKKQQANFPCQKLGIPTALGGKMFYCTHFSKALKALFF
jgi:hypothetical protein